MNNATFKTMIEQAMRSVRFSDDVVASLGKGTMRHRNRIVERVTSALIEREPRLVYEWVKDDIVVCEDRANHYGVRIGECVGTIKSPKNGRYYSRVAQLKHIVKVFANLNPVIWQ